MVKRNETPFIPRKAEALIKMSCLDYYAHPPLLRLYVFTRVLDVYAADSRHMSVLVVEVSRPENI